MRVGYDRHDTHVLSATVVAEWASRHAKDGKPWALSGAGRGACHGLTQRMGDGISLGGADGGVGECKESGVQEEREEEALSAVRVRRNKEKGMTGWWRSCGCLVRVLAGYSMRVACVLPHMRCGYLWDSEPITQIKWLESGRPLKTCSHGRQFKASDSNTAAAAA